MIGELKNLPLANGRLSPSEEHFRQLAENIHQLFWLYDLASRQLLYVSPAYEEITGRPAADLLADPTSFLSFLYAEDQQRYLDSMLHQLQGLAELEYRIVRPDGSLMWLSTRSFPVYDEQGHLYRLAGVAEDISQRRRVEQRLLAENAATRVLAEANALDEAILGVLQAVGVNLGWQLGEFWAIQERNQRLERHIAWHTPTATASLEQFEASSQGMTFGRGQGIPGYIWDSGTAAFASDLASSHHLMPRYQAAAEAGLQELFAFPARSGRKVLGVFTFFSTVSAGHDPELVPMLDALGKQVGQFMARLQAEERMQQQNAFLVSLHEMTLQLMSRLDRDEVLAHILTQAARLMKTAHGFLYLVDPDSDHIEVKVAIGIMARRLGVRLRRGEGLAGRVWESGQPMAIIDYPQWEGRLAQFSEDHFHSIVGVPLKSAASFMGVIGLVRLEAGRPFSQHELNLLGRFAQLAAIALDHATVYQQAQQELVQRREAEAQLRRTSSELQAVLEAFPDMLFRLDAAGVFLDYKSGSQADLLAPPDVFLGKSMREVLPLELAQRLEAAISQLLQTREMITIEYSLPLPVGMQFFEARLVPFLDEQVIVKIRNISQRIQAEKRSVAFANLAQLLNPITAAEAAAEVIVAVADQLIGWDACWLNILTPDGNHSQAVITVDVINGRRQEVAPFEPGERPLSPIIRQVLANGKMLIHNPPGADPADGFIPFGDSKRASATLMFVPVRNGPQVTGILSIQSYTANAYTQKDLETLQALADHAGGALDRIRAENERQRIAGLLQRQNKHLTLLYDTALALLNHRDLNELLQTIIEHATQLADAPYAELMLLEGEELVTWTANTLQNVVLGERMDRDEPSLFWQALDSGQPVLLDDFQQRPYKRTTRYDSLHLQAVAYFPILSGAAPLGVLALGRDKPGYLFDEEQVQASKLLAQLAALALNNAQIFEVQRETAARQFALYEVLRIASGQFEPEKVARLTRNAIQQLTGWSDVAIVLLSPDGHYWEVAAPFSETAIQDLPHRFSISQGITGRAIRSGQLQYAPDVSRDPDFVPSKRPHTHSEMVVPLRLGDHILGALNLESDEVNAFNSDDIALAESLAGTVALALDNARLYNETAQQHSRLAALIDSSRDGIIMIDREQRIQVLNEAALSLLGLPGSPADWLQHNLGDALALLVGQQPAVASLAAEVQRISTGGEPAGSGQLELPSHIIHWVHLPVTGLPSWLWILRNVTEEHLASRLREDLTQTMVHDLRNPLSAVAGAAELLETDWQQMTLDEQQQMLAVIRRNTDRLLVLVSTILDIARLESRQMPLQKGELNLAETVADTLRLQTPLALEKHLQLVNEVSSALPPVWADGNVIGRVLQNLVENAIKFTPPGGVIQVLAGRAGPSYLEVTVTDSGPGIPLDIQGKLFQKFVTGRQAGRGSGLGLAFCRLAVEAHNGRISVESHPLQGTRFHFTLPIHPTTESLAALL